MKRYICLWVALLLMVSIACQKTVNVAKEEEAIKAVLLKQSKVYYANSLAGEDSVWAHEPFVTKLQGGAYNPSITVGWDSIRAQYERTFERSLKSQTDRTVIASFSNHHFRILNNVAWVVFDQKNEYSYQGGKYYVNSKEIRILEKNENQWEIVFHYYTSSPETNINSIGNYFLSQKKYDVAIEIFKRNAEMNPNYDGIYYNLGSAYLENGNKKMAKENLEKCLKLNHDNIWAANLLKKL